MNWIIRIQTKVRSASQTSTRKGKEKRKKARARTSWDRITGREMNGR